MHQIILLVIFLGLTRSDNAPSKDSTQNPVKRFNLQDLLAQQNIQINPGNDKQDAHIMSPKTQTIDVAELLAAAQKASAHQPQLPQEEEVKPKQEDIISKFVEPKKAVDIDITADKNGNFNLENIPGLTSASNTHNSMSINDLQSLLKPKDSNELIPSSTLEANNVVREEINLGKQKLEIEAAGKRATRYTLAKGPDGGLNLIPLVDDDAAGRSYEFMQPKQEYEEKGRSRQQMQMTTLSQALYSPFPSDANILHLHLKGKDGKDGKAGNKGPMGPLGPKGPDGPKGAKGDAGTCSSQINGLFECTPDELDSLSNRVDYLEKICKKVENAAKKHNLIHSAHKNLSTNTVTKSDVSSKIEHPKKEESTPTVHTESSAVKEKVSTEAPAVKEQESAKEKEPVKEKEQTTVKYTKEEEASKLKEKEALKLEKEIEESGVTRAKKDGGDSKIKEVKEKENEEKTKEKEKVTTEVIKEKIVPKEVEKAKEKEDSKDSKEEVASDDEKSSDKKDSEPIKKMNKDGSPPTERSMIDIKAKLKIAELDLMDRINQARAGAAKSS